VSGPNSRNQRNLLLGAGVLVLAILSAALTLIAQRTQSEVAESAGWVSHTLEVAREFQITLTLLDEAETGQRGFLLTERDAYLPRYDQARLQVDSHVTRLRALTADNPAQQTRLVSLSALTSRKLAELAQTVAAVRGHRREDALQIVETDEGQRLMDAIHGIVAAGIAEEEELLRGRETRFTTSVRRRSLVIIGLGIVILLSLAIIGWLWLRLERVRALVTICSWSKSVEYDGEWITFEEYLLRRFNLRVTHGISPDEAARYIEEHGDPRR
jgi:CHASE3 domain sensor protein